MNFTRTGELQLFFRSHLSKALLAEEHGPRLRLEKLEDATHDLVNQLPSD